MTETTMVALTDPFLADRANQIRALGKRVVADIIEIGRLLAECKEHCGHGNWLPWLDAEFGWNERTAQRYINDYDLAGKYDNLSDLGIGVSIVHLLAAPSTPEAAREEVIERAEAGERLRHQDIREIIKAHGEDAVIAAVSDGAVLGRAKSIRHKTLQAATDARKAEFARPVAVTLVTGLHHGDFRMLENQIETNSVDLVLIDPEYDNVQDYGDAARIGDRILKPGGSFIAYSGGCHLREQLNAVAEGLRPWALGRKV
jgi:hypothetical protein